ncbi:ABC transporter permease [Saccharopolyspora taberi]|uniref:Transport permease protein n=1 Tax=Saccharopolyspora taberi TaxID=60895 RepID=A0ABN3VGM3_9PSEU
MTSTMFDVDSRGWTSEVRAGTMVWRRELVHFLRTPATAVVALLQPMLFLYILGVGLSRLFASGGQASADSYLAFLFPGVLVMAAQAPALAVGASIVWDRQTGFLREMLVAPVRRSTLLVGKCLGGATVATCQGAVVLVSAGLVGIPYRVDLFAVLLAELSLAALSMTVFAAVVAVSIRRLKTYNTMLSVMVTPMLFLSGMMFPISAMPRWMEVLALANPLTYAVDAMRGTVEWFTAEAPGTALASPVAWFGWAVPAPLEIALVAAFSVALLAAAARRFSRPD